MSKEIYKKELSDKVLGMLFNVHNSLGPGLLESAYEEAMAIELEYNSIPYSRQKACKLYHRNKLIKCYISDIIVDNTIILELKSVRDFDNSMYAQIINYLKISGLPIGYLVNLRNASVLWRRFVNIKHFCLYTSSR
jgi:GxxExxY protein